MGAEDSMVAVTGAELPPKVDGEPRETWTSFAIRAGQTLSFDYLKSGARACIAVAGGIDVPVVLGSRSTYTLGALGGFEGRNLQAGDELTVGTPPRAVAEGRGIPENLRRVPGSPVELRVMPGLYRHRVTEESGCRLFEDTWTVAPEAELRWIWKRRFKQEPSAPPLLPRYAKP